MACFNAFNQLYKIFPNCLTGLSRTNKRIMYLHIRPQAFAVVVVVVRSMTMLIVMISMYIEKRRTNWNANLQREHTAFK